MADDPRGQRSSQVRFDWGSVGAARTGRGADVLVVVDVLSFTTAVSVVVERGTAVHPAGLDADDADRLARDVDARLAVRRSAMTAAQPWSLSPAALRTAPRVPRLVLPSPNGSAIAAAARGGQVVVAACLRNASAVGAWCRHRVDVGDTVAVIAAGERWPDGSLRPALEDLLGAGAVLSTFDGAGLSPEAAATRSAFATSGPVSDAIHRCASGLELHRDGFEADVAIAADLDSAAVVPVLSGGAFRAARPQSDRLSDERDRP